MGQRFYGESGPSFLHIGLKFEYTEVNVRRKLDAGPVESLSRLKRAAEQRYNSQV